VASGPRGGKRKGSQGSLPPLMGRASGPERPGGSGAGILIVDDDPETRAVLRLFLEGEGWKIRTATSVAEAWTAVTSEPPALMIIDYAMPGMSGLELCALVRNENRTRDIPIILHTAVPPAFLPRMGNGLYDRVLTKPAELPDLAIVIRALLEQTPDQVRSRAI
jgi:CheY-like chemotaxis protein